MLDSGDRERIPESHDEIWKILGEEWLKSSVLLVLANKQDLPNAMPVHEIIEKLELNSIKGREWCKLLSSEIT